MSNEFTLRFHGDWDDKMRNFVNSLVGRYVFIRETEATRIHIHAYVETETQEQALRKRITRTFPDQKGNGFYSLTGLRKSMKEYMQYICKGEGPSEQEFCDRHVLARCGFELSDLWKYHEDYWKENRKVTESKKKDKKARSNAATIHRVLDKLRGRDAAKMTDEEFRQAVAEEIMTDYDEYSKSYGEYQMKGLGQAILCTRDGFRRSFESRLAESFTSYKI